MLDASAGFTVAEVPGVTVYPDDRLAGGFYALPSPRIALADKGLPEVRLQVYGRTTTGADFEPTGGLFTCTTSLALTADEESALLRVLDARLAEEAGATGEAVRARRLSPDWRSGRVELELTPDLVLAGQPSLYGDNRCSFSRSLTAAEATELEQAWDQGLEDASITYEVGVPMAASSRSSSVYSENKREETERGTHESEVSMTYEETADSSTEQSLSLTAPVGLSAEDLRAAVQRIDTEGRS